MLRNIVLAAVIALSLPTPNFAQDQIPGVKGELILIEKNAGNANQAEKIRASVGDKFEITWSYPVVPGSIPTVTTARSDAASVRFEEIRSISRPKIVGGGMLGAFFVAEKEGTATLTFAVRSGPETGVILRCEVQVVRPGAVKEAMAVRPDDTDVKKLLPEKSRPTGPVTYEGRVRNILARQATFGFSVRNEALPGESGFYLDNSEANRTLIETILFAARSDRAVRIYYDDKTMVAEAIETWGW